MHIILLPLVWTHLIPASSFTLEPQVRHTLHIKPKFTPPRSVTKVQCVMLQSLICYVLFGNDTSGCAVKLFFYCTFNSSAVIFLHTRRKKSLLQDLMRSVVQRSKRSDLGNSNLLLHQIFNCKFSLSLFKTFFLMFYCENNLTGQNNKSALWLLCPLVITSSSETQDSRIKDWIGHFSHINK